VQFARLTIGVELYTGKAQDMGLYLVQKWA
jgi:hypothetical protein